VDIKAAESKLREKLAEEIQRLEMIEKRLRSTHSASFGEQAIEREGDEVDERMEETIIHDIDMIKAALDRIEAGKYEICSSCGEQINEARLEALPYTNLCINCARQRSEQIIQSG
jgi:RNA polymerase-binding transcription factor DksA